MQARRTARYLLSAAWAAMALAACGCAKPQDPPPPLPREMLQGNWQPQEAAVQHVYRRDYRLREGDQVEIIYQIKHNRSASYHIKIEDVIEIRFPFNPALNRVEQVQSDGSMNLDLIGKVQVVDRMVEEVQDELVRRYSRYIKDPVVTVSFKESNVKIRELIEAIKTAPRGMSRLVPIVPDGTISLPFIVDIRAAGLTVGELHRTLNEAYQKIGIQELEVSVNVQTVSPMQVYVFGEVRIPGALLNKTGAISAADNQLTLLQAIAQAGSYLPGRAELSKVLLVRRRNLPRPQNAIINVYQLLENTKQTGGKGVVADSRLHRYDVWLEDGDIIYVPTAEIAKRADYIEYVWTRGIRAVGGFSSSASYSVSDTVDWVGPNH